MINNAKDLAKAIADARKAKNIKQEEMARALGITQSFLSRIERGERSLEADKLIKLIKILDVDLIDLGILESNDSQGGTKMDEINLTRKRKETKSERTSILLTPSTKEGLRKYAKDYDSSMNDIVEKLGSAFLEANQKGNSSVNLDGETFLIFKK